MKATEVIEKLGLAPLEPEGGFFRRTYQSERMIEGAQSGKRHLLTTIYYLMTQDNYSSFHRLPHVEIFHFYAGAEVQMNMISPEGSLTEVLLGNNLLLEQVPQLVVPPNYWQAARISTGAKGEWALLGTTVSPGFDFADFELGNRGQLLNQFPMYSELIRNLTQG